MPDATDYETLIRVWSRADNPLNQANADKMRQVVFDALVDCWEKQRGDMLIQCVDGRIARILGALVLLDFEERNWSFHRLEDLKNELFELARKEIEESAKEATKSKNPKLVAVGKAYLAKTQTEIGELDEEMEKKWIKVTKTLVRDALNGKIEEFNRDLPGAIPKKLQQGIIEQALSAI